MLSVKSRFLSPLLICMHSDLFPAFSTSQASGSVLNRSEERGWPALSLVRGRHSATCHQAVSDYGRALLFLVC